MTPAEIMDVAERIHGADVPSHRKEAHFHDVYPEFRTSYPGLYKMCCQLHFDIAKLRLMSTMLGCIQRNEITQHDASVVIGQGLFDEFVTPVVPDVSVQV